MILSAWSWRQATKKWLARGGSGIVNAKKKTEELSITKFMSPFLGDIQGILHVDFVDSQRKIIHSY